MRTGRTAGEQVPGKIEQPSIVKIQIMSLLDPGEAHGSCAPDCRKGQQQKDFRPDPLPAPVQKQQRGGQQKQARVKIGILVKPSLGEQMDACEGKGAVGLHAELDAGDIVVYGEGQRDGILARSHVAWARTRPEVLSEFRYSGS